MAARLPTLPAAVVPVAVGSAAAYPYGAFSLPVMLAAMVASVLIQVGTNYANDLFDFIKGADTEERLGPVRATQSGLLTGRQMAWGTAITFGAAFLVGLYLTAVGGWPIMAIGVAGILAGVLYTAGPWPLGYHGLGDVFVFIFFGLAAVLGTFFLHTGMVNATSLWLSIGVGCPVTAILVVNNLRDIETDRKAGKRTLAVRLGPRWTRVQYVALLLVAYGVVVLLWSQGTIAGWLPLLSLPVAVRQAVIVWTAQGRPLNRALKGTGLLHLLYGSLLSVSLVV